MWVLKGITFICLVLGTNSIFFQTKDKLLVEYQWRFLDYDYESLQQKQGFLQSGELIPRRPFLIDADVYFDKKTRERTVFGTTPRFLDGIPATVGTIVVNKNNTPVIKPYPSWDWHTEPKKCKPNRMLSVFRVFIDECDRMWVLDNGFYGNTLTCSPQVLIFDLKTNSLIQSYQVPKELYCDNSIFGTIVVEILSKENNCKNSFAYLTDTLGSAIIVYDGLNNKSWRAQHYSMYPDPDWAVYNISGDSFSIMDGVVGLALSPTTDGVNRKLFYHAMSADTENWVYTRDLRNQTASKNTKCYQTYTGRRRDQSGAEAMDKDGVLYYGLMKQVQIGCFDIRGMYGANSLSTDIVANNHETLQFATGAKVITTPGGREQLWLTTCRFQIVYNDRITNQEVNFRILVADTEELKKGTRCQRRPIIYGNPL